MEASELLDYLDEVDEGADRMSKIIDHLRTFSRKSERSPTPFSVNTAIRSRTIALMAGFSRSRAFWRKRIHIGRVDISTG